MKTITVNARMAQPGPAIPLGPGLPNDIQWMPPGKHRVWPENFEQPFDMVITPDLAIKANADLQRLRSNAANGQGNMPYGDFNHSDGEQSFEPLEFFWAGDDPKTGGVRLRVKWSALGEERVRGRAYRSFSPSWRLHKDSFAFLGVGLNVGGLVNRSAFSSIQALARGHEGEVGFQALARAYGDQFGIQDQLEAEVSFSRTAKGRAAYDDYMSQLLNLPVTVRKPTNEDENSPRTAHLDKMHVALTAKAKAFAQTNGLPDDADPLETFCRTAEGRLMYDTYCDAL
ncbi:MAG TPA: hypothetical protein VN673_11205 [Clostridia bacterium]|nr:hypothetical protein [Clostridia bacterium]